MGDDPFSLSQQKLILFRFREREKKNQKYSMLVETESVLPVFLTGVCNLCNGGVKFVRNNDRNRLTF